MGEIGTRTEVEIFFPDLRNGISSLRSFVVHVVPGSIVLWGRGL